MCVLWFSSVYILIRTHMPSCHMRYNAILLLCMALDFTISFPRMVINASPYNFELS
jgi:hypothetical protein